MRNLSSNKKGKPQKGGKTKSRSNKNEDEDQSTSVKVVGSEGQTEFIRVRLPKNGEILGVVTQILGADRIMVSCTDGNSRIVRIPGKFRKRLWCRQNDIVSVMPWYGLQEDSRGDLVWRYNRNEADWLEKKGYIKLD
ncbi:MAG: translation initiation factor eIF-1A [Asgard group archaeon]|nr:translation initiation factor eIF-1A [Asgard group archaeon]